MAVADAGNDNFVPDDIKDDDVRLVAVYSDWPEELFAKPGGLREFSDEAQFADQFLKIPARLKVAEQAHAIAKNRP